MRVRRIGRQTGGLLRRGGPQRTKMCRAKGDSHYPDGSLRVVVSDAEFRRRFRMGACVFRLTSATGHAASKPILLVTGVLGCALHLCVSTL